MYKSPQHKKQDWSSPIVNKSNRLKPFDVICVYLLRVCVHVREKKIKIKKRQKEEAVTEAAVAAA